MKFDSIIAYLADQHRRDLLREAQHDALVAEATAGTVAAPGNWERALRVAANLLVDAGQRLNAYLCRRRLVRLSVAATSDGGACIVAHDVWMTYDSRNTRRHRHLGTRGG